MKSLRSLTTKDLFRLREEVDSDIVRFNKKLKTDDNSTKLMYTLPKLEQLRRERVKILSELERR